MSLVHQPLLIGAWIGLIHALDADHISTLSSLAVRDRSRSAFGYAARWACGHAIAISLLGTLALGLGMLWLPGLSHLAELAVAALLIALGTNTIASIVARGRCVVGRVNAGDRPEPERHRTGLVMGLLHGGAGSAAVLALMPLSGFETAVSAAGFLLVFSLGVAAGALLFAAILSGLVMRTIRSRRRAGLIFAVLVGTSAIVVGSIMILGTLNGG